jgi:hypothetical protein
MTFSLFVFRDFRLRRVEVFSSLKGLISELRSSEAQKLRNPETQKPRNPETKAPNRTRTRNLRVWTSGLRDSGILGFWDSGILK